MQLKPWTEIAIPHQDVLKGTFQQAEFAADLSRVREGTAGAEYTDPIRFFERTFITEGMRLLLDGVVRRLNGRGGDPVIQLQTAFGGGKTHTLLAVYHLAAGNAPVSDLRGIPSILDDAGVTASPRARVAVIDGNRHGPSQPRQRDAVTVNCLWGEIAWQLGGEAGYELVAASDLSGVSPGKETLIELLEKYAPVIVLIDEMVGYLRQFQEGQTYAAGTFDSNLSFIQALTEAMCAVPNAILLASLPESHTEMGSVRGQTSLATLEKYFGRVQALWKPVGADEAFEIVRRRLFNPITDTDGMESVCHVFADYYRQNEDAFPVETLEGDYLRRLRQAYPIHPEFFSRLYEDWSTLDGFQRTRGVLKLMAKVIYRLWQDGNRDLMIMPGALPLYDIDVKNEIIYYLPQGWDPVVERDVDGERAQTTAIDTADPRLGAVQAARRAARTIFLGSAPSVQGQMVRGIDAKRVHLGAGQPGVQPRIFSDALNRLTDRLHYLNIADGRCWFDVRPNLRREMEERKRRFQNQNDIYPEIRRRLAKMLKRGDFDGLHIFTPSGDIPDDFELRLVVLAPETPHARKSELALSAAGKILANRGSQPRQHQNRLIFIAADQDSRGRLLGQVRTLLAWQSISDDVRALKINLDMLQIDQVNKQIETAAGGLNRMISECYRWLLCPLQSVGADGAPGKTEWETFALNSSNTTMADGITAKLVTEEVLIKEWSPIHLDNVLQKWFWRNDRKAINTQTLWQTLCDYLYMPRLLDAHVLRRAIAAGVESGEYFAYADGLDGETYRGLKLGQSVNIVIDKTSLIVELETAKAVIKAKEEAEARKNRNKDDYEKVDPGKDISGSREQSSDDDTSLPQKQTQTRFFGTVQLDPHTGRMQFDEIHDEIISQFTLKPGTKVTLRLDIEATLKNGFDENIQRAVRENSNALNFDNAEFEN